MILIFLDVTPCSLVSSPIMKWRPKAPLKYYNLLENIWAGTVGSECTYWPRYGIEGSWFQSRQRQETSFLHISHTDNGITQPPVQWAQDFSLHLRVAQMLKMSTAIPLPPSPNLLPVHLHSADRNFTFNVPLYSWWIISWRWRQHVLP